MSLTVASLGQQTREELVLLRAHYVALLQSLQQTEDRNPETLQALKRIFPGWVTAAGNSEPRARQRFKRRRRVAAVVREMQSAGGVA